MEGGGSWGLHMRNSGGTVLGSSAGLLIAGCVVHMCWPSDRPSQDLVALPHPTEVGATIHLVRLWKPGENRGPMLAFPSVAKVIWCAPSEHAPTLSWYNI